MSADAPSTPGQIAEAVLLDDEQRHRLFAYAASRFGIGREDSEDLLQDTMLELLRSRTLVRSPEGFVFAVFRTRCARFLAKRAASRSRTVSADSACLSVEGVDSQVDSQVALHEALKEVSSSCRQLLCAYYVEGRSLREAASALSLAYSSVSKTISRCLKRLRKCLS
jgi:RNA polymerase sigma factor (sigma-70 family)